MNRKNKWCMFDRKHFQKSTETTNNYIHLRLDVKRRCMDDFEHSSKMVWKL